MEYQWFEELPPSCPPFDSVECNGTYFRVSYGNPAESEDFFSQNDWHQIKFLKEKVLMIV